MAMNKILAVQGDDLPVVTLTITDLDDNLVSLAGCSGANIHMRKVGDPDVRTIAAVVDVAAGTVSFDFSGGALADSGDYELEVELDFLGKKHTLYNPIKLKARAQIK